MTEDLLNKGNTLKQKIEAVEELLNGIAKDNVITVGVGLYPPIRYNAEISDMNDKTQEVEQRVYNRIKEILEAYKNELIKQFDELV